MSPSPPRSVLPSMAAKARIGVMLLISALLMTLLAPASFAENPREECSPFSVLSKIDGIGGGYSIGDILPSSPAGQTITVTAVKPNGEILTATWASATPVYRVVLKAGDSGGNTQNFAAPGASAGTLASTGNHGFSHVTFCSGTPAPADLTITKVLAGDTKPVPATDFSFTVVCGNDTETFDRSEADGTWSWNTDGTDPDLVAGTSCTVTEAAVTGATTSATYEGASYTPGSAKVLAAGTNTNDFVFTNTYPGRDPLPASVSVTKNVTGNNQPATTTAYGFTLICDGITETFTLVKDAVHNWAGPALTETSVCTLQETQRHGATGVSATFNATSYNLDATPLPNADLVAGANAFVVSNAFNVTITRIPPPPPPPAITLVPGISIDKTADDDTYSVGDTITYTYVITNTGEMTLTFVNLHDDVLGNLTGSLATRTLAPGESTTVTTTQAVTEDHVGSLTNVAVTSGRPEVGERVSASDEVTVDVAAVLGVVIDRPEPAPAPAPAPDPAPVEPAPEVAAEELAATGIDGSQMALIALAMLLVGGLLLRRPEWE